MPRERKRVIGAAGDDVGGHGEDEADDAAEEAAQGGDDEHDERVDVEAAAHHLGLDEVLQQQVGGEHDHEHDHGVGEAAVAEGDDDGEPAAEEGADVGDVAADEVDDHDREHEREAEQQGGEADDHRDDGGHDAATLAVVAQDPEGVAEEAVDVAAQRRAERADDGPPELVAVLEQVVHDQRRRG